MADQATLQTEEAIIQEFLAPLAAGYPDAFGLKDDCALISCPPGSAIVVKTDAIAAGVHFHADDDARDIGWKALAVNVSDLAAKSAVPRTYVMSLAFPQPPTRAWMAGFAQGLAEAQAAFGMHLIGGDTDRRPGPLSITPCVFGEVPAGRMIRRGAAEAGDAIYVSGTLGDSALGLALRQNAPVAACWNLSGEERAHLLRRYHRPEPRLGLRAALRSYARAAMDISDGLAKDLGRMCKASGVMASIAASGLPLSTAARRVLACDPDRIDAVVAGGDDYELLMAVPVAAAPAFEAAALVGGVSVTRIGMFAQGSGVSVFGTNGQPLALQRPGYDHF